jgi:nanoRNase/pAp phosphatase (c-di-AMP/oligoRNAs hydrolase)
MEFRWYQMIQGNIMTADKPAKKSVRKSSSKKKLSPFEKWLDEAKTSNIEKVSIVMHDNPDPDAIASAFALRYILDKVNIESVMFWSGEMDHTQNKIFVNITKISNLMTKLNGDQPDWIIDRLKNHPIIIVDTSCAPGTGNLKNLVNFIPEGKQIDLVIDHHQGQTVDPKYYHHESYGSCAAIFYEILAKLGQISRIDSVLATALFFAIEKDTDDLKHKSTTDKDREYHEKLEKKIDKELYYSLIHFKYPIEKLDIDKKCHTFLYQEADMIIAGGGFVISQKKSFLASVADGFINEYENINFVCVMGITYNEGAYGGENFVVSVRYNGDVLDVDEFMKAAFGSSFGARDGVGGGSEHLGKQLISIIDAVPEEDEEKRDKIFKMIFEGYKKKIITTKKRLS